MDNDLIKKYLANELSSAERHAFEIEMENDPFLMEAIEGLSMQHNTWAPTHLSELEEQLKAQFPAPKLTTSTKHYAIKSFFKYAAAACVIGILALVSWRLFITSKQLNEQEIYAAYFHPLTNTEGIVRGENKADIESAAVQAYENEDYYGAVKHYEQLVRSNPENVKYKLYFGISLLASNQTPKAIEVLSTINTTEAFNYDVQWYLALAYLRNKDIQHAQPLFSSLTKENNYYQKQALEITQKLEGKLASVR